MRRTWFLATGVMLWACGGDSAPGADGSPVADGASGDGAHADGSTLRPVETLATADDPRALALDSTHIYWTEIGGVQRLAKTGGTPEPVAERSESSGRIAVDEGAVYWTAIVQEDPADGRVFTNTPFVSPLATDELLPHPIAVDANYIYWANGDGETHVRRIARTGEGSEPLTLATLSDMSIQIDPSAIAVDSTTVYWANYTRGEINQVPKAGGDREAIVSGQVRIADIALHDGVLYWVNTGTFSDSGHNRDGSVRSVPAGGGAPRTLSSGEFRPRSIAVDQTHLYWTNLGDVDAATGSIRRVSLEGGAAETLVENELTPLDIAVDDERVYWINDASPTRVRAIDK